MSESLSNKKYRAGLIISWSIVKIVNEIPIIVATIAERVLYQMLL